MMQVALEILQGTGLKVTVANNGQEGGNGTESRKGTEGSRLKAQWKGFR
jgi:hypothetical protein